MINKKIQFFALFLMTFSISAQAAQQVPPTSRRAIVAPTKTDAAEETGGTYRDEVEIMKFDEYTGRDSYAIPFQEDAVDAKQTHTPVESK